jgi:F0F1-type ATP synthase membrane subunit b/b'
MPAQIFDYFTLLANTAVLLFVGYYFIKFKGVEKEFEKKEKKVDKEYHRVVDDALEHERKILSDTTNEAEHIIAEAKYVSSSSKEILEQALQKTVNDILKESLAMGHTYLDTYQSSLKEISQESQKTLTQVSKGFEEDLKKQTEDFRLTAKSLETSLQKQIQDFHNSLLPTLEKELESYKTERLKQIEEMVVEITQKASQEVLNRSIPQSEHQKLIIESLEKAKKEGVLR